MNNTIKQLFDRKSVRVFTDEKIKNEIVDEILCSAAMAPTAGNQQLYTILNITDEELKRSLSESCDHQPFIATAPLVLIFCADCLKWYDAFKEAGCDPRDLGEGDLMLAVCDALIAAQNTVVAAESYGIGSCYIGDIMENCEIHREVLRLPKYVFPVAMIVYGYPTEQQKARTKPRRCDMKYIVHENTYRRLEGDELKDMLTRERDPDTYGDWIHAFCKRKYNSDFSREMTRSVRAYLEDYKKEDKNDNV